MPAFTESPTVTVDLRLDDCIGGYGPGKKADHVLKARGRALSQNDSKNTIWGRGTNASLGSSVAAFMLTFGCPVWVTLNWIAIEHCRGSLLGAVEALFSEICNGDVSNLIALLPKPSWSGTLLYIGWLVYQAILFHMLPGRTCYGQQTPG